MKFNPTVIWMTGIMLVMSLIDTPTIFQALGVPVVASHFVLLSLEISLFIMFLLRRIPLFVPKEGAEEKPTNTGTGEGEEGGLSQRQLEFKNKFKEGLMKESEDVIIRLVSQDGEQSGIIVRASGTIEIEGNPPEGIVQAALGLQSSIRQFGTAAIADELRKQIEKLNEEGKL